MSLTSNLPNQPMIAQGKFKAALRQNLIFLKSLFYLAKKVFML